MRGARAPVLVILGPTASGKTSVAIELAGRVGGEIISADSRAFFRGLDLVTDKPTEDELRATPHHLIDRVPIEGSYDAMAFRIDVEQLIPQIRSRGHRPILAGGGTLYLGAVLRGLFEGPARDDGFRAASAERPADDLYRELQSIDPEAAQSIHAHDRLRVTRALEVYHVTGTPISRWHTKAQPMSETFLVVGLRLERAEHRARIERRVRRMLRAGVLEEIRQLRANGLTSEMQAFRTIGVPEAFDVLDGSMTEDTYAEIVSQRTWQLVRRQMAWFQRERDVHWIDVTHRTAAQVADWIVSIERASRPAGDL